MRWRFLSLSFLERRDYIGHVPAYALCRRHMEKNTIKTRQKAKLVILPLDNCQVILFWKCDSSRKTWEWCVVQRDRHWLQCFAQWEQSSKAMPFHTDHLLIAHSCVCFWREAPFFIISSALLSHSSRLLSKQCAEC